MSEAAKVISVSSPNIKKSLDAQRAFFATGATRPIGYRLAQLDKLNTAIHRFETDILAALKSDLGKTDAEGFLTEISIPLQQIAHTRAHLREWARPRPVPSPMVVQPATSEIVIEPKGVTLLIGPWNYPFLLLISPLITTIGAGNTAILKASELAPETSRLLAKLVRETFDPAYVTVIEGGAEAAGALLEEAFDHIFFTGGTNIGRIVMEKAARHLTPVTLELGGKSPAFVTKHANVEWAAKRIVWSKFLNTGQTCVAPDYVLVDRAVAPLFLEKVKEQITKLYGSDIARNSDYGRIVNQRHWKRLVSYLAHGRVALGGKSDENDRFIEPTVLVDVNLDSALMEEEIFGPILPVIEVDNVDAGLAITRKKPHPLALYVFSKKQSEVDAILSAQTSGGACINDCMWHMTTEEMPFGGVGASGMGGYHGRFGFDALSHQRSVLRRTLPIDVPLLRPPYGPNRLGHLRTMVGVLIKFFS